MVFWGRLIPAIRTLISVPAGIELMPFGSFLFWTTAGSLIWTAALTGAGWALGSNWQEVLVASKPLLRIVPDCCCWPSSPPWSGSPCGDRPPADPAKASRV